MVRPTVALVNFLASKPSVEAAGNTPPVPPPAPPGELLESEEPPGKRPRLEVGLSQKHRKSLEVKFKESAGPSEANG